MRGHSSRKHHQRKRNKRSTASRRQKKEKLRKQGFFGNCRFCGTERPRVLMPDGFCCDSCRVMH